MRKHEVTIVKKSDVADLERLKNHPKVIKYIEAPFDYVFFEYFDEIFLKVWSDDPKERNNQSVREAMKVIEYDIVDLLKPLYSQLNNNLFITGYEIYLNETMYSYRTIKQKRSYIPPDHFKRDLPLENIIFKVFLRHGLKKYKIAYEKVLNEWIKWGKDSTFIKSVTPVVYNDDDIAMIKIDFNSNVADCMVALLRMLDDTRSKTAIAKFSID
jgi:hypothetical protein